MSPRFAIQRQNSMNTASPSAKLANSARSGAAPNSARGLKRSDSYAGINNQKKYSNNDLLSVTLKPEKKFENFLGSDLLEGG